MVRTLSKKYYKPRDVAKLYDVQPRTVVRWIRDGKMRAVKVGRVWRIPEEALDDCVQSE